MVESTFLNQADLLRHAKTLDPCSVNAASSEPDDFELRGVQFLKEGWILG